MTTETSAETSIIIANAIAAFDKRKLERLQKLVQQPVNFAVFTGKVIKQITHTTIVDDTL